MTLEAKLTKTETTKNNQENQDKPEHYELTRYRLSLPGCPRCAAGSSQTKLKT